MAPDGSECVLTRNVRAHDEAPAVSPDPGCPPRSADPTRRTGHTSARMGLALAEPGKPSRVGSPGAEQIVFPQTLDLCRA